LRYLDLSTDISLARVVDTQLHVRDVGVGVHSEFLIPAEDVGTKQINYSASARPYAPKKLSS
jgi:hypothetical protein